MAALRAYEEKIGAFNTALYQHKRGFKNVPFDATAVNTNYTLQRFVYVDGNTHLYGSKIQAEGGHWQEYWPWWADEAPYDQSAPRIAHSHRAYNKAYGKFKAKVYEQSELLASIAERADTFSMIASRATQLFKAAKSLRKGRFGEFLTTLNIVPNKRDRGRKWIRPKQFSRIWLEYWMGWAPLAGDIYTLANVLGSDPSNVVVKVSASTPYNGHRSFRDYWTGAVATSSWTGKTHCYLRGLVEVTNPTVFRLNQLGLLNPVVTAWQLLPFSFIADWFTNIGNVLSQVTDWLGLKLKSLSVSTKVNAKASYTCTKAPAIFGGGYPATLWRVRDITYFTRKANLTGLPTIKPYVRIPNGLSLTRGLTSISLLVQLLR